ncbi:MAG: hypothetical protein KAW83_03740, partial [Dehalococcoidia bacterium]|nr:hypothetical protein [Dehalococcoidia bacterium]
YDALSQMRSICLSIHSTNLGSFPECSGWLLKHDFWVSRRFRNVAQKARLRNAEISLVPHDKMLSVSAYGTVQN